MEPDWLSAREAAKQLDVKLETLYAYTSRGLVESVPAAHGRGRLYARAAIERLKARHDARAGHAAVAAGALRWGEPTLETSVSEIRSDGPYYRGHSALALCEEGASFEDVAELLWSGQRAPAHPRGEDRGWGERVRVSLPVPPAPPAPSAYLAAAVALAALADPSRHGASELEEHARARRLIAWFADIVGGRRVSVKGRASVAQRLLASYGAAATPVAQRLVDTALILSAEHELNASTFAARVAASTGADLYACLGAALQAHSGPRHGGMAARLEALVREIKRPQRALGIVRERLARGEGIPGFGHPLYPTGDPRGRAMLALTARVKQPSTQLQRVHALCAAMRAVRQPAATLDVGLVAVCCAARLPEGAASALFAIGRSAGWIAHALEQRSQGYLLRPRARYLPPPQI